MRTSLRRFRGNMEDHMYIKIDVKCIDSAVCRSKIVKARFNGIIGHVISDLLDELDKNVHLKISRIESSNTDIDPQTQVCQCVK